MPTSRPAPVFRTRPAALQAIMKAISPAFVLAFLLPVLPTAAARANDAVTGDAQDPASGEASPAVVRRIAVFQAAGPGMPPPELLADIDAAVRRSLVLTLPAEGWTTLMAGPTAPGCTGRCAVARAAEYGAQFGFAVRVDEGPEQHEVELTVHAAPDGRIVARREARSAHRSVLAELAGRAAAEVAKALTGSAPARTQQPLSDGAADAQAQRRRLDRMRAAAGANSVGMQLLLIEPGRPFRDPPPGQTYVQARPLPDPRAPFLLATTEVTRGQWQDVMGEPPPGGQGDDDAPVTHVTWLAAVEFCNALSACEGLEPAYTLQGGSAIWHRDASGYRLPTDAEWEYACRAGSLTMFSGGGRLRDLDRSGWFRENSDGRPRRVARKEPNAWGLHDMHGNVWEWIWDLYADLPDLSPDNVESPGHGPDRTFRGGSWYTGPIACRTTNFCRSDPAFASQDLGFRIARSP
jgi:formylglycine-generating enzyme required for sulfatase activity